MAIYVVARPTKKGWAISLGSHGLTPIQDAFAIFNLETQSRRYIRSTLEFYGRRLRPFTQSHEFIALRGSDIDTQTAVVFVESGKRQKELDIITSL